MKSELSGSQSIERAIVVLREIAKRNLDGARLLDLAQATGLHRPTVHRILKRLVHQQMVVQDRQNPRYILGPLISELGVATAARSNLREICAPALGRIAYKTGDTVFLTQRLGRDAVCLAREAGAFPIKAFTLDVGTRRPLGIGAGSLAILGALPNDEVEQIVAANAWRFTKYGKVTVNSVLVEVRRARKLGYLARDVMGVAGVRSVGCAIRDSHGVAFAAISVSAISRRMTDQRIAQIARLLQSEVQAVEANFATAGAENPRIRFQPITE